MTVPPEGASAAKQLTLAWGGWGVCKLLAGIGIHSWSDFAGMAAGALSLLMIAYNGWKWYREWRAKP
jgi:hypothetical protein